MTCSFHAPEGGDEYQLPMGRDIPAPEEIEGFEAPFPFDVRELGATERREDGTYASTGAAGSAPGSGWATTRPSTPASWPTSRT